MPGKFCPRSIALIAARESFQGSAFVIEATCSWVSFCASRVARRKLPTACWADSTLTGFWRAADAFLARDARSPVLERSFTLVASPRPAHHTWAVPRPDR